MKSFNTNPKGNLNKPKTINPNVSNQAQGERPKMRSFSSPQPQGRAFANKENIEPLVPKKVIEDVQEKPQSFRDAAKQQNQEGGNNPLKAFQLKQTPEKEDVKPEIKKEPKTNNKPQDVKQNNQQNKPKNSNQNPANNKQNNPKPKNNRNPQNNNEKNNQNNPKKENNTQKQPVLTKMKKPQEEIQESQLLSVTEFYCIHYSLIKEIIDNVLSVHYGSELAKAIEDFSIRQKIESESFEQIRLYMDTKELKNLDYKLINSYIQLIYCEAMGFGILELLLTDNTVDEIMVKTHDEIYIERGGVIEKTDYRFPSFDAALGIVRRIIRPLNKSLDVSNPNVDGQLPNGSRISASIPPLRAEGQISITIRKFSEKVQPLSFYAEKYKSSTPEMVQFIESCVKAKKTIIVSGGTGSGKTTLLNSLSYNIDEKERIIVIENTREIHAQIPHVEYYLTIDGNNEGYKGINISDIIQYSLRKRPDRIIVGECRGGEFNEYLNAANTGHEGSMTSVHADSPKKLFARMENMLLKNDETKNLTHDAIMRILGTSVDIIVQTKRLADGSRRITNITEVLGYGEEGFDKMQKLKLTKPGEVADENKVYMRDIFFFKEVSTVDVTDDKGNKKLKVNGQFMASGYIPFCNKELKRKNVGFDKAFFAQRVLMEV